MDSTTIRPFFVKLAPYNPQSQVAILRPTADRFRERGSGWPADSLRYRRQQVPPDRARELSDSAGFHIAHYEALQILERRMEIKCLLDHLTHYQRMMSRRQKFSNNWKKAKRKVRKVQARIANCRKDFRHKTSTSISQNHAVVYIEDLQVRNMSKSASGTLAKPGKNVRAKSGLNRSILDQGWGEFRRQLTYKLEWTADCLSQSRRTTLARRVQNVTTSRPTTGSLRPNSPASSVGMRTTPTRSAR